ncbi:testis-expressed protein 36 isoform X2 [Neoarius graeffei]|nr:testis-expressed protein 36 isoform X2 [Neoarius graeffei]
MLSQAVPQHMQGQERYPKMSFNPEKKTTDRSYPFSKHDNRCSLQDNIDTYNQGSGRKKCMDDRRQHTSHFCFCDDDNVSAGSSGSRNHSTYQADFLPKQNTESAESTQQNHRFPKNHLEQSNKAAVTQSKETYMWFARDDMNQYIPLNVLAGANHSSAF